jgi:hypothetical protein
VSLARSSRRAAVLTVAVVVSSVVGARPASAHTLSGVQATNYRSQIASISPSVGGVSVHLLDLGRKVEVTNRSSRTLLILGYSKEPYLRVGPAGVFVNQASPTFYLNRPTTTAGTQTVPKQYSATAPPVWFRTSSRHTVTWADRRTRQEGADPQSVTDNRGRQVLVSTWTIAMVHASTPITVSGTITYIPPPNGGAWLLVTVLAFLAVLGLGLLERWHVGLAGALALVLALNVVDATGSAVVSGGSHWAELWRVLPSMPVWILALLTIGPLQRKSEGGLIAAAVVGFFIAAFNGLGGLSSMLRSQVPFAWDANVSRVATALALGIGFGLLGGVAVVFRRFGAEWTAAAQRAEGRPST